MPSNFNENVAKHFTHGAPIERSRKVVLNAPILSAESEACYLLRASQTFLLFHLCARAFVDSLDSIGQAPFILNLSPNGIVDGPGKPPARIAVTHAREERRLGAGALALGHALVSVTVFATVTLRGLRCDVGAGRETASPVVLDRKMTPQRPPRRMYGTTVTTRNDACRPCLVTAGTAQHVRPPRPIGKRLESVQRAFLAHRKA